MPLAAAAHAHANGHSESEWIVHKFGGTSIATSECYRNAASIVLAAASLELPQQRQCVVVSAMGEIKPNSLVTQLIATQRAERGLPLAADAEPIIAAPVGVVITGEKVTNLLIKCTEIAAADRNYDGVFAELKHRHMLVAAELLQPEIADEDDSVIVAAAAAARAELQQQLELDFLHFSYILKSIALSRSYDVNRAWYYGYGELWSARMFAAYLNFLEIVREVKQLQQKAAAATTAAAPVSSISQPTVFLDARDVLTLAANKDTVPDYELSVRNMNTWLLSTAARAAARIVVVTGYIAMSASHHPTTLGRDGSDYSASIFARLLLASSCIIWTDVDGVYSANPTQVAAAVVVAVLSYEEASELAYFGAKVIHPKTMTPVVKAEIPIWIRNTFNSSHQGSCITSARKIEQQQQQQLQQQQQQQQQQHPSTTNSSSLNTAVMSYGVKGISEIRNLALLRVEGTSGLLCVAHRLFTALHSQSIDVIVITQGGSEHSICVAVKQLQVAAAVAVLCREFRDELSVGDIVSIEPFSFPVAVEDSSSNSSSSSNNNSNERSTAVACLAVVGDGMRSTRGVAGRFFSALADSGISIVAIAQGGSERNISAIVEERQVQRALESAHAAFLRRGGSRARPQQQAVAPATTTAAATAAAMYSPLLRPQVPAVSRAVSSASPVARSHHATLHDDVLNLNGDSSAAATATATATALTLNIAVSYSSSEEALQVSALLQQQQHARHSKSVAVSVVAVINRSSNTMLLSSVVAQQLAFINSNSNKVASDDATLQQHLNSSGSSGTSLQLEAAQFNALIVSLTI